MTATLADIDAIAEKAHSGQFRKFNGEPYIEHPRRVSRALAVYDEGDEILHQAIGLLHDVLEDTDVNSAMLLRGGVTLDVVQAVQVLTRGEETYGQYLDRVILSGNKPAIRCKAKDLGDNLSDLPLGNHLRARYEAAQRRLGEVA